MTKRKVVAEESKRSSQRQSGPWLAAQVTGAAMALAVSLIQSVAWSVLRASTKLRKLHPTLRRSQQRVTQTTGAELWRKTVN